MKPEIVSKLIFMQIYSVIVSSGGKCMLVICAGYIRLKFMFTVNAYFKMIYKCRKIVFESGSF